MCQYSSEDGFANDWHLVHLVSRAVGGTGLVMTEANAVLPKGRITPQDLGIWQDQHVEKLAQIVELIHRNGDVPSEDQGRWITVAPSAVTFKAESPAPKALNPDEIQTVTDAFASAARRSLEAGFQVLRFMRPTATCSTNLSLRSATNVETATAVALRTSSASWLKLCRQSKR